MSRKTTASRISRRETLKWISAVSGSIAISTTLPAAAADLDTGSHAPWPKIKLTPVKATGYGTDPDLIAPATAPWPRLMNDAQLATAEVLADIIIPAEGDTPAASQVGVVEFIDEWISAPYPTQQEHRALLVAGLMWLDHEAERRFSSGFLAISKTQRLEIIDDLADPTATPIESLMLPQLFFNGFRSLTVGAFFTTPEGIADLGYQGNIVIAGDYPGPSREAEAHLQTLLEQLGLEAKEINGQVSG